MCDKCSNPSHEFDNVQQVTEEEMQDIFAQSEPQSGSEEMVILFPPLESDDDQLFEDIMSDEYNEGKAIGLKYSGLYEVLLNHGMPISDAVTICINEQTLNHNYNVQKLNAEISKNQVMVAEKSQL